MYAVIIIKFNELIIIIMLSTFEKLSDHLKIRILKFFQTNKLGEYENISTRKKTLVVKTDIQTLINLSETSKTFEYLIKKSDHGLLMWNIYYDSLKTNPNDKWFHSRYCHETNCTNICHYLSNTTKYTDIFKKIAIHHFSNRLKKGVPNLDAIFGTYLNDKQIKAARKVQLKKIHKN